MKINMINTNSVMRTICAVVVLLGMNVSAWGLQTGTLTMSTSQSSPVVNNGVTFTWSSTNIVTGSGCGFKGKAGTADMTITIPTGCTLKGISKVNSGSSWGGGAGIKVYTGTNTSGTLLKTIVTGTNEYPISSNNTGTTYYLVNNTSANAWINSLSITYGNAAAYKVTFDAEGGTCATSSLTEAGADAGVTLPAASPSASMEEMGWGFYGWAESAVSTIASSATIVGKAGDTYYPSSATTLHAVYAKGTYTVIKSTSEITSGEKYLIGGFDYNNNELYIMTDKYRYDDDDEAYYMSGQLIGTSMSETCSAADVHPNWRYIINYESGKYFIKNNADTKYIDVDLANWVIDTKYSSDYYTFTINSSNGYTVIKNNYASKYLVLYAGGDFGRYTSDDPWDAMLIYKETVTPKYCSNPSTVRLVASPAAGGDVVFDDNSSAEMDFATDDGYIGDITATPNSGYDFLNWVSSDESAAVVGTNDDPTTGVIAEGSATITANFYQKRSISYILTEGGVAGEVGNPTTVTKDEKDGFLVGFNLQAHYKNMTLVSVTMGGSPLTEGAEADYEWEVDGSTAMLTIHHANIDGDIVITVSATLMEYTKYAFSCAELTLTPHLATEETPIFITSTANKTVRSQDYIEITGNGLTPSTALTFPGLPSKFAIKNADGTAVTTDVNGEISANAYIFYTPDAGDTSDGLDKLTGITVSVEGAKPKTVNLTQDIIGRHLPADFVIAGKKDGKWYALPATMETGSTPDPDEIAIDDSHNPGIAYTSENNVYGLEGPSATNISGGNGQYVKLTMSQLTDGTGSGGPAPLYASNSANIGKNGTAGATSDLSTGWWWALTQTATDITNPQDAKYTIKSPNNSNTLSIKNKPFVWGLYASGVEELRLIPRSNLTFTEAEVIAWGQKNLIVQVDKDGISATQVQAKLNGSTSSRKSLATTTGTSVKGSATKYNYTLDFTDEFDFSEAAATDKTLLFEWLDAEGEILKVSSVVVPKIIALSSTMSSIGHTKGYWKDLEVHVLPGVTLTANTASFGGAMTIKLLEIYPGATVQITTASSAGTLTVDSLIFRNGWNRLTGAKSYDVARLYIQPYKSASEVAAGLVTNTTEAGAYMDWYIDYDQYYPVAVPFPVATSSISYKNTTSAASKGVKLRYYDGARRAANVQQNQDQNWVEYNWDGTDPAVPTNLEPSHGYIMTAKRPTGKAFSIIRMPLTIPSASWISEGEKGVVDETHKDQVTVTAWGNENTPSYAKGWNIIANPYMSLHQGELSYDDESGEVIEYANIPDINFKEYDQLPIDATKLKPSSAFLVQAPKDGTVTFGTANRKAAAPSYRQNMQAETYPRQKAYIVLASEDAEDMMGIWISDKYSAEYEINADLEKLMGDGKSLRTYMHWNEMKMAYLAINKELAQQYIPVSVRIETEGKHTFSMHSASKISELKSVYLIDFETGAVTNLLESSYPFYSTAGTINDRFAINALVGPRDIPTDLDVISAGNEGTGPIKFIYHDKVFILHEGVIYDSTGKKVREIKK